MRANHVPTSSPRASSAASAARNAASASSKRPAPAASRPRADRAPAPALLGGQPRRATPRRWPAPSGQLRAVGQVRPLARSGAPAVSQRSIASSPRPTASSHSAHPASSSRSPLLGADRVEAVEEELAHERVVREPRPARLEPEERKAARAASSGSSGGSPSALRSAGSSSGAGAESTSASRSAAGAASRTSSSRNANSDASVRGRSPSRCAPAVRADGQRPALRRRPHLLDLGVGRRPAAAHRQQRRALLRCEREVRRARGEPPRRGELRGVERQGAPGRDGHAQRGAAGREEVGDHAHGGLRARERLRVVEDDRQRVDQERLELHREDARRLLHVDRGDAALQPLAEHVGDTGRRLAQDDDRVLEQTPGVPMGGCAAQPRRRAAARRARLLEGERLTPSGPRLEHEPAVAEATDEALAQRRPWDQLDTVCPALITPSRLPVPRRAAPQPGAAAAARWSA